MRFFCVSARFCDSATERRASTADFGKHGGERGGKEEEGG